MGDILTGWHFKKKAPPLAYAVVDLVLRKCAPPSKSVGFERYVVAHDYGVVLDVVCTNMWFLARFLYAFPRGVQLGARCK